MNTARFKRNIKETRRRFKNWLNDIRIKRWAKTNDIHAGTRQILTGGIWIDKENNIYNCIGRRIGKIQWEES